MHSEPAQDDVVDAFLTASRALVGVAARSLGGVEVTLAQYRAVVVVAGRPGLAVRELAEALAVHPTTATRMCDRLVDKGLLRRSSGPEDRRTIALHLTTSGRRLVERVGRRRRREIAAIVDRLDPEVAADAVRSLAAFAVAAGEVPLATEVVGAAAVRS